MTEQSGPFVQSATRPGLLNLGLGQPSPALLPIDALRSRAGAAIGHDPLLLQYGALRGYEGFLDALARFLTASYAHPVRADELMVTGGISSALGLVADVFGRGHRRVVVEDPTYFLARGILETAGLDLVGVPADRDGLDTEMLAARLEAGLKVDFVYCIPSHHNPCGVCLAPERASHLVDLAEAHDFMVVADEPYVLLDFGERSRCMASYDAGRGRVLSLGSFSKILGPGLRLGWAHAEPAVVERLTTHGVLRSGGGLNPVVSALVHGMLEDGFLGQHVEGLGRTLARRCAALVTALRRDLPSVRFDEPTGGYFVWIDLGEGVDATRIDEDARSRGGVGFTAGPRCAIVRNLDRYARLSFSFYDEQELTAAVARLAAVIG